VVAHPVFYPQLGGKQRIKVFSFMRNVLLSEGFEPERVNDLLI